MMKTVEQIAGGVTAARGYRAAGAHAGLKHKRSDVALVVSDQPATVAAMFTTNRVQAAPVLFDREQVADGMAQAIFINSGNANACTGPGGLADTRQSALWTGAALGIDPSLVLICSTGVIGVRLPMAKIEAGVRLVSAALSSEGGDAAAKAIMTTDTVDKQVAVRLKIDGKAVVVGGMAKGAGMIDPTMATMLAFVTTDAAVEHAALKACLAAATAESFNRITIDGDQSTNDTVILLANGMAGTPLLTPAHADWPLFVAAVKQVCTVLARKIVEDGEGATKFVTVTVNSARDAADARLAARAIANSLLAKTAWTGGDPNWGRVIAAVGYSGAHVVAEEAEISFDAVCAYSRGHVADAIVLAALEAVMQKPSFTITVELHLGSASETVYTCDVSKEYVQINSEYTS